LRENASSLRRVIFASFLGTTIEWYDFFLYGITAALVFNKLFFPTLDPLAGTLSAHERAGLRLAARLRHATGVAHHGAVPPQHRVGESPPEPARGVGDVHLNRRVTAP
jgi:hypothetical protein